jgi:hypothetical protein
VYQDKVILLVAYDLKGPSTHYAKLYEHLKGQEGWWHYLGSTWLISTRKTPKELAEEIKPLLLDTDRFLVARFGSEYWGWITKDAWDWIKNHASNQPGLFS